MTTTSRYYLYLLAASPLLAVSLTMAQSGASGGRGTPQAARSAMNEASRILKESGANGDTESRRRAVEQIKGNDRVNQLLGESKQLGASKDSPQERALTERADQSMSQALKGSSAEGQALLAQNATAPRGGAPPKDRIVPVADVVPVPTGPADAQPRPLKPNPLNPAANKAPERTVITCQGAAFFDSKQAMGVFTDDVEVSHPQFHLNSDMLEVHMVKESEQPAAKPVAAPRPLSPGEKEEFVPDGNIKQAIATGKKVVVQKLSETGELQIGICRHATYVGSTGEVFLRNYPQVQRGQQVVVGTDPSTIIILKPNGQLDTKGPTRVDIIQQDPKKAKAAGAPGANPAAAATTTPQ